jgi:hypothetical protein
MEKFTVRPSDFAYIYDKCPRCYWRKARGVQEPRDNNFIALGDMFDEAGKVGLGPAQLFGLCGISGVSNTSLGFQSVKSKPITFGNVELLISGKFDKAFLLEDSTSVAIIELKSSKITPDKLLRFRMQTHCYLWALENPLEGEARQVEELAVISFSPVSGKALAVREDGQCAIRGQLVGNRLEIDRAWFLGEMEKVANVLSLPSPPNAGRWCGFCKSVEDAKALDLRSVAA